jgi:hypothetical protein
MKPNDEIFVKIYIEDCHCYLTPKGARECMKHPYQAEDKYIPQVAYPAVYDIRNGDYEFYDKESDSFLPVQFDEHHNRAYYMKRIY